MPRFLARLRRELRPHELRCTVEPSCPKRAVVHLIPSPGSSEPTVRACVDHPPVQLLAGAKAICEHCGNPFWPDPFHFDCG